MQKSLISWYRSGMSKIKLNFISWLLRIKSEKELIKNVNQFWEIRWFELLLKELDLNTKRKHCNWLWPCVYPLYLIAGQKWHQEKWLFQLKSQVICKNPWDYDVYIKTYPTDLGICLAQLKMLLSEQFLESRISELSCGNWSCTSWNKKKKRYYFQILM